MPDVLMPRLSDTMTEGILAQWLMHEGDPVHPGDILAEIETDKATMELEAYDEGIVEQLLVPAGTTVPIGQPIAIIGDGSGARPATAPAAMPAPTTTPAAPVASAAPVAPAPAPAANGAAVRTSPLARALAREHGIDLSTITGTGPGGRIVRADVEAAVAAAAPAPVSPRVAPPTPAAPAASAAGDVEEVALTAVRRVTAKRLSESAAVPTFDLVSVVDAEPLLAFRADVNTRLASTGTKISVTDLLVRACAMLLREHPQVNSSWGGDKILRRRRVNVGIAVALDDGLIVPVVRDADRKSVGEIAVEARALAERARAGKLMPDEFSGGTFTISNLGMYGIDHFTAVINPPEAAILTVGAATPVPVVRDGELVAGTTMTFTLTIDHRVLDGASAAVFLRDLKAVLEEPLRIVV